MSIVHQLSLFSLNELMALEPQERYEELFLPISFERILPLFRKHSAVGPPMTVNYDACLRALVARYVEHIPQIKSLVKRLKEDLPFRLSVGFAYNDPVPSQATFSRILTLLSQHLELLQEVNDTLLLAVQAEQNIFSENLAIDATSIKAYTHPFLAPHPEIPKLEQQRQLELQALEKKLPLAPSWGNKRNSQNKDYYWFGYKGHFLVSTQSQYLLHATLTSAYVADSSVAFPLLGEAKKLGLTRNPVMMDKGYDAAELYQATHELGFEPIIDHKKPPKQLWQQDQNFAPTCPLGYSYIYDSFDKRYDALKYKRPEHLCAYCSIKEQCQAQKVKKIKQSKNYRNYAHPARGSKAWNNLYKERAAVERVNAYLKENYQLENSRATTGERVTTELLLIQLTYNSSKFANQRLLSAKNLKQAMA